MESQEKMSTIELQTPPQVKIKNETSNTLSTDTPQRKPGVLNVIRRNGKVTIYDDTKIAVAITKAFLAIEGQHAAASARIHEKVAILAKEITEAFNRRQLVNGIVHIEAIQDQVELALMRSGEQKVARAYVLYREEHRKIRDEQIAKKEEPASNLNVMLNDGSRRPLNEARMKKIIAEACFGLTGTDPEHIFEESKRNLFDGVPINEVNKAIVMTARTLIEQEPNYTYATARLLLDELRGEALSFLGLGSQATFSEMNDLYPIYFQTYINKGVECKRISPELKTFDLEKLGQALKSDRDHQFTYLSMQTLYDRYFLHHQGNRIELPQAFFMRVAMGLAINEKEKEKRAIEFYELLSSFDFMSSTPTLFNSGTLRPQLSSCFLTTVPDDLDGIFGAIKDNALLSKFSGGLGNDWTQVRALGSHIKGTNGESQGIAPFLKVANDTAVAVNQGGKRKGAVCAYLETWHLDIEEFLDLRKNTGDDRRRTHDMNTANWVPDLFMKRVEEDQSWTLFSPTDTPDLHDLYGKDFETAYIAYEEEAKKGNIKNHKRIPAKNLWRKMLSMLFETGHPWITFKDPCNLRSPQQHAGVIHSSNLCTEITLNTSKDEVAVCNLGSVNLPQHMTEQGLDVEKLKKTVKTAIRMLDNVIDINYYSIPQASNSNLKHRPIGLGVMGFQDCLYKLNTPYSSEKAIEFADTSMEHISYYAIEASNQLAVERGSYESFEGSLWSQGILPIDSIDRLAVARDKYLEQDRSKRLDWVSLCHNVKKSGMRNSNVLAIAPTATISNICGVSQSIEPTYQNLFVKSNMSGEFTVLNMHLVNELKNRNLWDDVMINDLKYYDGSVQNIERVPEDLKEIYATAFEMDARWLIEAASRRQKWIDQGQSLNLYMAKPSGKKLDTLYRFAWKKGLKTTYYLRSLAASSTEKATLHKGTLNAVKLDNDAPKACAIDDPDCEACQ
jgi:ribonucleoside-diphosphate reductase alpha chain